MFQNASTEPALNPLPEDGDAFPTHTGYSEESLMVTSMPNSAEAGANYLMDDLFQDLDQLLGAENRSGVPDYEESYPDSGSSDSSLNLQLATEASPASAQSSSLVTQLEERGNLEKSFSAIAAPHTHLKPLPKPQPRALAGAYDRLLLAVGCISVIVTLALWLIYQEGRKASAPVATAPVGTVAAPSAQDTNQFADYVQKSLQNIDQKQGTVTAQAPASTPGMGTVTIPPTTVPGAAQSATGLSRIYVPVYEFPSNFSPSGTAVAPLPGSPGNSVPPGVTRPSGTVPGTAYNLPFGTSKPGGLPGVKPNQRAGTQTAAVPRKLVGVMDQGNGSVALFEVNGITQRYEIGESIGSSGWTLVEVSKDQAIIRRNGEVRSLFVGHSF